MGAENSKIADSSPSPQYNFKSEDDVSVDNLISIIVLL